MTSLVTAAVAHFHQISIRRLFPESTKACASAHEPSVVDVRVLIGRVVAPSPMNTASSSRLPPAVVNPVQVKSNPPPVVSRWHEGKPASFVTAASVDVANASATAVVQTATLA